MLCQQCQQREATNHITSIRDDVQEFRDLCNECLESSDTPVRDIAASMRDARCTFCGAPAKVGSMDSLSLCVGEQRTTHFCFRCSEEHHRFTIAALEQVLDGLSQEQQLDVLRRLRQDAERHMRDWLSRRSR
jgi:protein-arginine kinase activator protein McsA